MIVVLIIPVYGQINSPCSASMISSFSPCMGFVTNSSANGTSPTADCCNSLKSLTSGGMGCLCLILTGNIPLPMPLTGPPPYLFLVLVTWLLSLSNAKPLLHHFLLQVPFLFPTLKYHYF
ncbi:hypothetical protein CFP56_005475 [Quercus suber]|uniref:Bifunctional inhibitor/plant lipid transfer protein/seed storage helical domain-containing protein n=1 Tax=Quercus suber TaxID=58331 RepID=A0AAW0IFU0_QUESU